MTDTSAAGNTRTPWHLWVIGAVAVLWNSMGAFDYLMTTTKNAAYTAGFPPEKLEFAYSLPSWAVAAWAIAVWGGLLGSVLLLLRRRAAVWAFLASFVAMVITNLNTYVLSNGVELFGDTGSILFAAMIFVIALALLVYARLMARRGVLR